MLHSANSTTHALAGARVVMTMSALTVATLRGPSASRG
jgi:hypothetical protein